MAAPNLPSLAQATWLKRTETQAVLKALAASGHAARVVGGAVRNALLNKTVTDIDIATTARPEQVIAAAAGAGLKAIPTGTEHGTVTVVANHVPYEVTTLRRDVETHGRRATVAFTDDWAADARRRDFTINALYCDADGEVFDPVGAYPDLEARRVRCIGDPVERIREDYLRILRFFRFSAEYAEGPPDAEALDACVREREGLSLLSAERIRQELLKLLVASRACEMIGAMLDYGLITGVLSSAPRPTLMQRLAAIETELGLHADAVLRLGALTVEVPEDADRLRDRLRLTNEEHGMLLRTASRAGVTAETSERAAKAQLYAAGEGAYREQVLMAWARSGDPATSEAWRALFALPDRWQPPRFPLGGNDVLALGVPAGPRVGEILRSIEAWWINQDFSVDEKSLRAKLKQALD